MKLCAGSESFISLCISPLDHPHKLGEPASSNMKWSNGRPRILARDSTARIGKVIAKRFLDENTDWRRSQPTLEVVDSPFPAHNAIIDERQCSVPRGWTAEAPAIKADAAGIYAGTACDSDAIGRGSLIYIVSEHRLPGSSGAYLPVQEIRAER